jgi:hypothetical protein
MVIIFIFILKKLLCCFYNSLDSVFFRFCFLQKKKKDLSNGKDLEAWYNNKMTLITIWGQIYSIF